MNKAKQKALVEALLFASTEPVPLNKILRKLRQAEKMDLASVQAPEAVAANAIPEFRKCEIEAVTDNDAVVLQTSDDAALLQNAENRTGASEVDGTQTNETDMTTMSDLSDFDGGSDNVLGQLMQKQRELESDLSSGDVKSILAEIEADLARDDRGIELVMVAKGYQLRTKYDVSLYLKDEKIQAPSRFSPSSLETLAIVAYQQPVTRQKLEQIRGVDSGGVLKTLLDKNILRVVGRSDEPGRPLVYGTSKKFMEIFGLESLKDLPSLQDYYSLQMSQNPEQETDRDDHTIRVNDLLDSDMTDLSQDEQLILNDLDQSLENLKRVEKDMIVEEPAHAHLTLENQSSENDNTA